MESERGPVTAVVTRDVIPGRESDYKGVGSPGGLRVRPLPAATAEHSAQQTLTAGL